MQSGLCITKHKQEMTQIQYKIEWAIRSKFLCKRMCKTNLFRRIKFKKSQKKIPVPVQDFGDMYFKVYFLRFQS